MTRARLSGVIVLFLAANIVRIEAFGLDPPFPVTDDIREVVNSGWNDGRFSPGAVPLRFAAMVPLVATPFVAWRARWFTNLWRGPLRWYWTFLILVVATLPMAAGVLYSTGSALMLIAASIVPAVFVDRFGWPAFVKLIAGFAAVLSTVSLFWAVVSPDQAYLDGRLSGVALVPTHFAETCGLGAILALSHRRAVFGTGWSVAIATPCAACLVLSSSRGPIGAALIALVAFCFVPPRWGRVSLAIALLSVTPVFVFTNLLDPVAQPLGRSDADQSLSGRLAIWQVVVDDAADLAPTGVGYGLALGGQAEYWMQQRSEGSWPAAITYSHNMLVGTFVILGVAGPLLIILLFASYFRSTSAWDPPIQRSLDTVYVYLVGLSISEAVLFEAPILAISLTAVGLFFEAGRPLRTVTRPHHALTLS